MIHISQTCLYLIAVRNSKEKQPNKCIYWLFYPFFEIQMLFSPMRPAVSLLSSQVEICWSWEKFCFSDPLPDSSDHQRPAGGHILQESIVKIVCMHQLLFFIRVFRQPPNKLKWKCSAMCLFTENRDNKSLSSDSSSGIYISSRNIVMASKSLLWRCTLSCL